MGSTNNLKLILLLLPFVFSVVSAYSWTNIERVIPGCHAPNILDCVASFDGKMCFKGDMPFSRDCFECKCNVYGYWKCKNTCVNTFGGDQYIHLGALTRPEVSPEGVIVNDLCHPGMLFLQTPCVKCRCARTGRKSSSYDCERKFGCQQLW